MSTILKAAPEATRLFNHISELIARGRILRVPEGSFVITGLDGAKAVLTTIFETRKLDPANPDHLGQVKSEVGRQRQTRRWSPLAKLATGVVIAANI